MKKKNFAALLIMLFVMVGNLFCQIIPPPIPPPPPPGLPIDGGLGFLLVAGLIYGAKRIKN